MITRGFEIQTTDLGQVLNLSNRRVSPVELLELLNLEANCVKILVSLPLTFNKCHTLFWCSGIGIPTEKVSRRCSVKRVLLKILQNSQESTCARVSFSIKLQADRDSGTGVFL